MFYYSEYSKVIVFVFKYSLSASLPKSFPKPDSLNPPNGVATSVLLYLGEKFLEEKKMNQFNTYTLTKQVPASRCSLT